MKSRVSIDVDEDNQPIIKLEYHPSEDVRDKLVKKFLESFGHSSRWARTTWINNPTPAVENGTVIIRPVPTHELQKEIEEMKMMDKMNQRVTNKS